MSTTCPTAATPRRSATSKKDAAPFARKVFHGDKGELYQRYHSGMEDQLGALGLVLNCIVLWNTVYMNAAIQQLSAAGHPILAGDVARLSHRSSTSTSRCSGTSPSRCPTNSRPDNADRYAASANRLSVRSCSITTGRPFRPRPDHP